MTRTTGKRVFVMDRLESRTIRYAVVAESSEEAKIIANADAKRLSENSDVFVEEVLDEAYDLESNAGQHALGKYLRAGDEPENHGAGIPYVINSGCNAGCGLLITLLDPEIPVSRYVDMISTEFPTVGTSVIDAGICVGNSRYRFLEFRFTTDGRICPDSIGYADADDEKLRTWADKVLSLYPTQVENSLFGSTKLGKKLLGKEDEE